MSSDSAPAGEMLNLVLNETVYGNSYGEDVVRFYFEALDIHQKGGDLAQFLNTLGHRDSSTYSSTDYGFGENTISFILEGGHQKDGKTDYSRRLDFVLDDSHSINAFRYALNRQKMPSWQSQYAAYLKKKESDYWHSSSWEGRSRHVAKGDLDTMFDAKGRKLDQLDAIHYAMTEFAIVLDEPDLAVYFVSQLGDNGKKVELYFNSLEQKNSAQTKVVDELTDLKNSLENDPQNLCEYLIKEIGAANIKVGVDVTANARGVLTLLTDHTLFREEFFSWYHSNDEETGRPTASQRSLMLYRLAKALVAAGEESLLEEVLTDRNLQDYDEARHAHLNELLSSERYLVRSANGKLNRKELKHLRITAKQFMHHPVMNPKSGTFSLLMALYIAGDDKKYKYYSSRGDGWIKGDLKTFLEHQELSILSDYSTPEERQLYRQLFPGNSAGLSYPLHQRIQLLAAAGNIDSADSLYKELVQDQRAYVLHKLLGSIAMASAFAESPASQLEIESRIAAEIELLGKDISEHSDVYDGIIGLTEARQKAIGRVRQVLGKIYKLNDHTKQMEYLKQLQESAANHDNPLSWAIYQTASQK